MQARRLVRDSILGIERPQVDLDDQDWLEDLAQAEELAEAARQAAAMVLPHVWAWHVSTMLLACAVDVTMTAHAREGCGNSCMTAASGARWGAQCLAGIIMHMQAAPFRSTGHMSRVRDGWALVAVSTAASPR